MTDSAGLPDFQIVLLTAIIGLVAFGIAMVVVVLLRRNLESKSRIGKLIMEPAILIGSIFVLTPWLGEDIFLLLPDNPGNAPYGAMIVFGYFCFAIISLPVLLLLRLVSNRLVVVLGIAGWFIGFSWLMHQTFSQPIIEQIRTADIHGITNNSILVGNWIWFSRLAVWLTLSLVGGFYAVRKSFSYGKLVGGVVLSGLIIAIALYPFIMWTRWYLAPVFFAAFACILVSLPYHRNALERLFGWKLHADSPNPPDIPYSGLNSVTIHLTMLATLGFIAFSAATNYYEHKLNVWLSSPQNYPPRNPADQNAYPILERFVSREDGYTRATIPSPPDDYDKLLDLIDEISTETRQRLLANSDLEEYRIYFVRMREFFDAFERAGKADYLQVPGPKGPHYANLRDTARALALRGQIAVYEQRPLDAIYDLGTIYYVSRLLHDQPDIASHLIDVYLRNTANGTAWNLLAAGADNQELVEALHALLKEVEKVGRKDTNFLALLQGDLSMFTTPIVPIEIQSHTLKVLARQAGIGARMNFDLIQLATALELYRIKVGGYPSELDDLTPGFMKRIPREPIEGREYHYRRTANGYYELINLAYSKEWGRGKLVKPLFMPPMLAPDPEDENDDKITTGPQVVNVSRP